MLRYCLALLVLTASTVALTGCSGGSSSSKTSTATASPTVTEIPASPTPDLAQPDAIRRVSFATIGEVRKLEVDSQGSRIEPGLIIYADLTADGNQEAIVPITLGGASNITAFVVLTPDATKASHVRPILTETGVGVRRGLAIKVENDKLIETQAVPGTDDPLCCPSMLKVITYDWNGTMLVPGETKTIPNPSGGVKGTPIATAPQ